MWTMNWWTSFRQESLRSDRCSPVTADTGLRKAPALAPGSLCCHDCFQRRGSRINFHRNVRRRAGNFPVSYAVFALRIRMNPAAIYVVPLAKNRICLVYHELFNGTFVHGDVEQLGCGAPADFSCGQCSPESRIDLILAEVNVESEPGAAGLDRRGPIRVGDLDCRNARCVSGTRTVRRGSWLALWMVAVAWLCHGTQYRGGLDHLDAFNLDRRKVGVHRDICGVREWL